MDTKRGEAKGENSKVLVIHRKAVVHSWQKREIGRENKVFIANFLDENIRYDKLGWLIAYKISH